MRIDFHTHIWNTQLERVDEFVEWLGKLHIDRACVSPIAPYMSNEDVATLVSRGNGHIIGFASVVPFGMTTGIPRLDPVDDLKHAVQDLGLKGLKLHPIIQGFDLANPGLVPVVREAGRLGIPVLFHTGPSFGRMGRMEHARVEKLDDLAIMCPDTIIIAGHANPMSDAPDLARKHPNVYLETSISWSYWCSIIPGLAAATIERAGREKVLYGTDFSLGKEDRVTAMDEVLALLTPEDRSAIEGGNARALLGL